MRGMKVLAAMTLLATIGVTSASAETLNVNYERSSAGTTVVSTTATDASGSYTYGRTVSPTVGNVSDTSSGFYDDYIFTIGNGEVDSVTSTIDLKGVYGITGFQVRLFSVADALTPGTTGAAGPSAINAWTTAVNCGTGCTGTISVVAPHDLSAGTYDLQIRGTAEPGGGSYSGVLNVLPVPIPAAFPLLLSGIGMLGGAMRRRAA